MPPAFDPAPTAAEIRAATERLLATVRALSDAGVAGPSLLPGWSRGHVLTHLARNADSQVNLLSGAALGVQRQAYPHGREGRAADIEAGAGRPIGELVADIEATHARFMAAVEAMPAGAWSFSLAWGTAGERRPATAVLDSRLREVAIHHVDLDAGYAAADWPPDFALRILRTVAPVFEPRDMTPCTLLPNDSPGVAVPIRGGSAVEVSGPAHALAMWLLGRDPGASLAVAGGKLPAPPAWG